MIVTVAMGRGVKDATIHHASAMKSETLLCGGMADEKGMRVKMGRQARSGYGEGGSGNRGFRIEAEGEGEGKGDCRSRFGHGHRRHSHHQ